MKIIRYIFAAAVLFLTAGESVSQTVIQRMDMSLQKQDDDDDINIYDFSDDYQTRSSGKSALKALGLSLLLPGAGQYYTESKNHMMFFGGTEILIWANFVGFRQYGKWKKEDYIGWAARHAGVDVNNKDDAFFETLTYYDNIDIYNQLERLYERSGAQIYPDAPEYYWNWDSDANRVYYRKLRNDSKNATRRSLLFLGAAVVNRVLSGIDAIRSAGSFNRQKEFSDNGWKLYYTADGFEGDGNFELGIARQF